jgi:hypothetical protein
LLNGGGDICGQTLVTDRSLRPSVASATNEGDRARVATEFHSICSFEGTDFLLNSHVTFVQSAPGGISSESVQELNGFVFMIPPCTSFEAFATVGDEGIVGNDACLRMVSRGDGMRKLALARVGVGVSWL